MQIAKISNIADGKHHHNKLWSLRHHSQSLSFSVICSVRSSNSHSDLLLIHHPLFQITTVLDTGLSLSGPLQLYQKQSLDSSAVYLICKIVQDSADYADQAD